LADDYTRSIEDNYPSYVLETFGYQYDALEVIDRAALTRHDNLRHASREDLEAVELAACNSLEALAVAHRQRDFEALEASALALEHILAAPPHASVAIDEVYEFAILTWLTLGKPERAKRLLDTPPEWTSSWHRLPLLRGLFAHLERETDESDTSFDKYIEEGEGDRAERSYEIADLLSDYEQWDAAKGWLEQARTYAGEEKNNALLVDISLEEARLDRLSPHSPLHNEQHPQEEE
jgi:hypothetical protein